VPQWRLAGRRRRSIAGMPDSIFLVGRDGSLTEALGTRYEAEADLQELLASHPDLLPGARERSCPPSAW